MSACAHTFRFLECLTNHNLGNVCELARSEHVRFNKPFRCEASCVKRRRIRAQRLPSEHFYPRLENSTFAKVHYISIASLSEQVGIFRGRGLKEIATKTESFIQRYSV